MKNSQKVLLSPLFVSSLAALILNDFFLKDYFHNFLTGKLSDFAGVFAFTLFWTVFFPKSKTLIFTSIIIAFTFWKSSFSEEFIDWWNSFETFNINRTVDYTDLLAFIVLPLAWFYSKNYKPIRFLKLSQNFALIMIALISVFAFTATSYEEDRSVYYNKKFVFNGSKDEFDSKLKQANSISDIDITNRKENFANAPISNSIAPNEFMYIFKINKEFCESKDIQVFAFVRAEKQLTYLDNTSVRFWCKQKPNTETEKQVFDILEKEFINFVDMTIVESDSKIKNTDD